MYLPPELWHKIMVMSYYLMAQDKKNKFKKIHKQLKLSFNDAYDYHIDKYIGYESMLIALDDDGIYEFDDSKFKSYQDDIFNKLCKTQNLVSCIKAMLRNQRVYT